MTGWVNRRAALGAIGAGLLTGVGGYLVFGESGGIGADGGTVENTSDDSDDTTPSDDDGSEADNSGDPEKQPGPEIDGGAIVFTYDDGPMEDYEQAFPVHQEFEAPASTGIVTEWVGRDDYMGTDWMDVEYIRELQDDGWEIMSHTTAHTALGEIALTEDIAPEDTRI
jgi:peptidoglycan/xylan/chitin deacetylase (PgdA/CDA1 family)